MIILFLDMEFTASVDSQRAIIGESKEKPLGSEDFEEADENSEAGSGLTSPPDNESERSDDFADYPDRLEPGSRF
jgi:hypothetical protein